VRLEGSTLMTTSGIEDVAMRLLGAFYDLSGLSTQPFAGIVLRILLDDSEDGVGVDVASPKYKTA
jgi:hypothetical protein